VLPESLSRVRRRLEAAESEPDQAEVDAALSRAREALETVAERCAELEAAVPERLGSAIEEGMRKEVLPVGRQVAEIRGYSNQTIRRLERLQTDLDAERRGRVEDLGLLVDLIASSWQAAEKRLDRLERSIDRIERALEDRPVASVFRLEDRTGREPGPRAS
jgi:hypothetical protein